MEFLKLMAYSGGAVSAYLWGVAMGWYQVPRWSAAVWFGLWCLSALIYLLIPGKLKLER